ncbi:arginase, non-hepatic 3-like protein [Sarcoptes scabiei]|uniref:Arginase n=1 Tax=Sarcoptes scabiei TaxID=52283 RepID=A0A132A0M6_SARSC|nr:arginase, non-hepatic 3-like protein [Sarcoptes scabiei]
MVTNKASSLLVRCCDHSRLKCLFNRKLIKNFHIGVIGVPFWYGQSKLGTNQGPDVLRSHGLINKLSELENRSVIDFGNIKLNTLDSINIDRSLKQEINPNVLNLQQACLKTSRLVKNLIQNDFIPLMLGGDHSMAIGSVLGSFQAISETKQELSVIWIDAHADANTVQSSNSGNLHGMPVSFLVTQNLPTSSNDSPLDRMQPFLNAKNFVYIGLRDVEIQEYRLLKSYNICYYSMGDIDKLGINEVIARAFDAVDPLGKNKLHVSFDVDSVDKLFIPSTGTPVLGGLTIREVFTIAENIWRTKRMVSLDVVEFNPLIGNPNEVDCSANNIIDIILMFFGKSRLGYFPIENE